MIGHRFCRQTRPSLAPGSLLPRVKRFNKAGFPDLPLTPDQVGEGWVGPKHHVAPFVPHPPGPVSSFQSPDAQSKRGGFFEAKAVNSHPGVFESALKGVED